MYSCSYLFIHIDGDVQYTQSIDMIIIVGRGVSHNYTYTMRLLLCRYMYMYSCSSHCFTLIVMYSMKYKHDIVGRGVSHCTYM